MHLHIYTDAYQHPNALHKTIAVITCFPLSLGSAAAAAAATAAALPAFLYILNHPNVYPFRTHLRRSRSSSHGMEL